MLEIPGAVAVITGGGDGIGRSLARAWAALGGKLVLADAVAEKCLLIEKEIREIAGDVVTGLCCDVREEEDNQALAKLAVNKYGAINLVAPFAGITNNGPMLSTDRETGKVTRKMSLSQFQSVLDTNLTGVFLTVRECTEQMVNLGCKGLICLMSSVNSSGRFGQINYSSSKAAVSVMPKVITAELFRAGVANKIRCVAVAPGYVDTQMVKRMDKGALEDILRDVPIGRLIDPEEIVSLVIELYQNEAIAGEVFHIHGGLRLGSKG